MFKFFFLFLQFLNYSGYVLGKVYSWFKSHVPLFLGMVMYGYEIETKEIKFKTRIKLNFNKYMFHTLHLPAELHVR